MRLPLADRVLYGLGSLGNATFFWSLSLWLIYFYAPPEGRGNALIPIAVVRSLAASAGALEAFDDPLIGGGGPEQKPLGEAHPVPALRHPGAGYHFWLLFTPPVGADPVILAVYFSSSSRSSTSRTPSSVHPTDALHAGSRPARRTASARDMEGPVRDGRPAPRVRRESSAHRRLASRRRWASSRRSPSLPFTNLFAFGAGNAQPRDRPRGRADIARGLREGVHWHIAPSAPSPPR